MKNKTKFLKLILIFILIILIIKIVVLRELSDKQKTDDLLFLKLFTNGEYLLKNTKNNENVSMKKRLFY